MLNFTQEVKQPLRNFEHLYEVSTEGYVSNYRKKLKTYTINSGYACLKLVNKGKRTSVLLHRLIAETFIPNPYNKREVNHIDGDKLNNHVSNLEWVTSSENKLHAIQSGIKLYKDTHNIGRNHGKTSNYHNVSYDSNRKKWIGSIRHNKKTYFQKRFNTEKEAALHVNWILDELSITDRPKNTV